MKNALFLIVLGGALLDMAWGQGDDLVLKAIGNAEAGRSTLRGSYKVRWEVPMMKSALAHFGEYGSTLSKVRLNRTAYAVDDAGFQVTFKQLFAYDGAALHTLDTSPHAEQPSGYVAKLGGEVSSEFTPHTLLGRALISTGMYSLGEGIAASKVESVALEKSHEGLMGCQVLLLKAPIAVLGGDKEQTVDVSVRLWVDPERDWGVRRIEYYQLFDAGHVLSVLRDIEFEEIAGQWLPVKGRQLWYPEGTKLDPVTLAPSREPSTQQVIEITGWSLDALPPAYFEVAYAQGTRIWNGLEERGYVVGQE